MIDLGPCPQHSITETYCDECGVPNSSDQHGMDCSRYPTDAGRELHPIEEDR